MTESTTERASVRLTPTRDSRLLPYGLIAVAGLAMTLLSVDPAFAAIAAPFAISLGLGLRRTGPIQVEAALRLDVDRVFEGDTVTGTLVVEWSGGPADARLRLHRLSGVACAPGAESAWSRPSAPGRVEVPLRLDATQWGRHRVAEVWLRLEAPFGLLTWTGRVLAGPELRILPSREKLGKLLDPAESRAVWGMHRSRAVGDGHEFAELRPYVPGDRLRDLNWAATARSGRPIVNRHHPDLAGDVVLAVDAFSDGSAAGAATLSQAARAAWALASTHLRANDRVGLVGFGGATRWIPPSGGRRAQYRLLEALLGIGGDAAVPTELGRRAPRLSIPSSALVLALTSLHDPTTIEILAGLRLRGRAVSVLMVDPTAALPPPESASEALARRVWGLELGRRQRTLRRLGIPVVPLATDAPIGPAVLALARRRVRVGGRG